MVGNSPNAPWGKVTDVPQAQSKQERAEALRQEVSAAFDRIDAACLAEAKRLGITYEVEKNPVKGFLSYGQLSEDISVLYPVLEQALASESAAFADRTPKILVGIEHVPPGRSVNRAGIVVTIVSTV